MPNNYGTTPHATCDRLTSRTASNRLYTRLVQKFPKDADLLTTRFEQYTGLPLTLDNCDAITLETFKQRLQAQGLAASTVDKQCRYLSAAIKAVAASTPSKHVDTLATRQALKCKKVARSRFATVNDDEISVIIDYYRHKATGLLRNVAAKVIMEYYTGARISDIIRFTPANIQELSYIDKQTLQPRQRTMVSYVSQKSHITASIPVKPIVSDIINDHSLDDVSDLSTQQIDYGIKAIFQNLDLTRSVTEIRDGKTEVRSLADAVSSHTFRRSFATNLYLKSVPLETISRMMGHTNIQQTLRYIQCDTLLLDDSTLALFD